MEFDRSKLAIEEESRYRANLPKALAALRECSDPKDLFQSLFSDLDCPLEEPYGLRILNRPLAVLAPIFRQVVVPLRPVSEKAFEDLYGVSMQDFAVLMRTRRVVPILSKPYESYDPHFDTIFSVMHVPQAARGRRFFQEIEEEAVDNSDIARFRKTLSNAQFDDELRAHYGRASQERILQIIEEHLLDLKAFGYENLCRLIMATQDPNAVFYLASCAADRLTDPFTRGLGGFCNYEKTDLSMNVGSPRTHGLELTVHCFGAEIELYIPPAGSVIQYWDTLDGLSEREGILETLAKLRTRVLGDDPSSVSAELREHGACISDMSKRAIDRQTQAALKPIIDFGCSILAPSALLLLEPYLGTAFFLATQAIQKFSPKKWQETMEVLARPLSSLKSEWTEKVRIAPAVLWR